MLVLRIPTATLATCVAVRTIVNQKDHEVALECGLPRRVESRLGPPARRRISLQFVAGSPGAPRRSSLGHGGESRPLRSAACYETPCRYHGTGSEVFWRGVCDTRMSSRHYVMFS